MTASTSLRAQGLQLWYWIAPRIAVGLFMLALCALLWLLYRQELDEQRTALISDTLWVEQNLNFQLTRSQGQLQQLGHDFFGGELTGARFEPRAKSLLVNSPGMMRVFVLDSVGTALRGAPGPTGEMNAGESLRPEQSLQALRLSRSTGNPTFSPAYAAGRETLFDLVVPHFRDGQYVGSVLATYSVKTLLGQQVPWWFAQKYRLSVADANGVILGSKSSVEAGEEALSYQIPFDPPGHGLLLLATSYKTETRLVRNLLAVAIVGLAAAVLASLWALRRHMQRRFEAEQALRNEHAFRKAMEDSLLTGLPSPFSEEGGLVINGTAYIVDDDEAIRDALTWLFRSREVTAPHLAVGGAVPARLSGRPARLPCAGRAHGGDERPGAVRPAACKGIPVAGNFSHRPRRHTARGSSGQEGRIRFRREAFQRQRAGGPRHSGAGVRCVAPGATRRTGHGGNAPDAVDAARAGGDGTHSRGEIQQGDRRRVEHRLTHGGSTPGTNFR